MSQSSAAGLKKPVLYVPGLPASHLRDTERDKRIFLSVKFNDSLLEGPNDLRADDPVRAEEPIVSALSFLFIDLGKQAKHLYEILEGDFGIDAVKHGWDWRRPVWDDAVSSSGEAYGVQRTLERAIHELFDHAGRKIVVIVHSTGGLILRSLLESKPELAEMIDLVMAFGVPWAGLARSLEGINAQKGFAGVVPKSRAQEILTRSWAAWDLMPPDPTHLTDPNGDPLLLTFRKDASGARRPASTLTDLDWLHSLPASLRVPARERAEAARAHLKKRRPTFDLQGRSLRIVNVVGWGAETPVETEMIGQGTGARIHVIRDRGDDGLDGGDGTAPRRSAAWLRGGGGVTVKTYHVPVGRLPSARTHVHSNLWRNPGGRLLLHRELAGESFSHFCWAALDPDDSQNGAGSSHVRARLVALDADGRPLPDARVETRNLEGPEMEEDFDPAFEGRHLLAIPRARIPIEGQNVRRLHLRIGWTENGDRKWQSRSFHFPR